jgi:hypothetical protein
MKNMLFPILIAGAVGFSYLTEGGSSSKNATAAIESYGMESESVRTKHRHMSAEEVYHCMKISSEQEGISTRIEAFPVDEYSQDSIDTYNGMIDQFNVLNEDFGANCDGRTYDNADVVAADSRLKGVG